jgi:hypothetical protein
MDVLLQSLIDPIKWDDAGWRGTAFLHDPEGRVPPCLGVVFDNIKVGKEIFSAWLRRLGSVDKLDELRISIVEGEIPGTAPGYSVHVSSDPSHASSLVRAEGTGLGSATAIIVSRVHRMTPEPASPHLTRFKRELAKHKRYLLLPVSADIRPEFDFAIEKKRIFFRNASDIGKSDVDAVVFPDHYFDGQGVIQ